MRKFLAWVYCLALAYCADGATPVILTPPQSITINNASSAAFTVVATNASTYQWQFQGTNVPGATTSTLSFENATPAQAGLYTVVIGSSGTFVTNQPPAQLTLVPGTVVRFIFSGLLSGGTNFVDVQLFDHDKPVTVQNFLHYITAGAYTNMFYDRCIPSFVLQGGDYGATDRTNTTEVTGWYISELVDDGNYQPPFPASITNEFYVGPLIHNDFGTIAMAKESGVTNSAQNAFFFNLADNSANLDAQDGGFTVFGRVIGPTNGLQYFNDLAPGYGIVNDGGSLPNLPVNYVGTNYAGNANLVFAGFQFPAAVQILSPRLSSGNLTFSFSSSSGQNYIVWSCGDLSTASWVSLAYFSGTGAPIQFSTPANGATRQFFWVQAVVSPD